MDLHVDMQSRARCEFPLALWHWKECIMCFVFLCVVRSYFSEKCRSHISHFKVGASKCVLMCLFRANCLLNCFEQTLHWNVLALHGGLVSIFDYLKQIKWLQMKISD